MVRHLLTVPEVAKATGFGKAHIYQMLRTKRWPAYFFSRKGWRVDLDELRAFARRDVAGKAKGARRKAG